ncbi:unnamed protein product [Chironomus riparius]|uniref:Uncharacterized protein n=1 Tax=Chironomus riparius TaxID=315576 RepID=A0A9N9S937_9DIPT|nr:unnamed protein product [Chironomus riparius]
MTNFKIFIALFTSIIQYSASQMESIDITCSYGPSTWYGTTKFNECSVSNKLVVVKRNYKVKSVKIITEKVKAELTEVESLSIEYVVMYFLLQGFENHLQNITALRLGFCQLKEITKNDLKVFPKLKFLWIWENDLEVLEADLFLYNPDMIYINFYWNFLKSIDANIFNNLKSLDLVYMYKNTCINMDAKNKEELLKLVDVIKEKCMDKKKEDFVKKVGNFCGKNEIFTNYFLWIFVIFI